MASFAAFVAGWVNSVSTTRCRLLNCNHFCFFSLTAFLVFTAVVRTNILSATSFGFIYMSCSIYLRSILANFDKILEKNIFPNKRGEHVTNVNVSRYQHVTNVHTIQS